MYSTLVTVHSTLRWAVVAAAVLSVLFGLYGTLGRRPWDEATDRLGSFFTWMVRLNLLLGIVLWVWRLSGGATSVFFTVIHPLLMFVALALAEILAARRARATDDAGRWRLFLLGTLIPSILIFAAIPWNRS